MPVKLSRGPTGGCCLLSMFDIGGQVAGRVGGQDPVSLRTRQPVRPVLAGVGGPEDHPSGVSAP
jgi:hypothetical protein